ncbi:hypothetical protein E1265_25130 [Streptomyces sp. 8K308]|nr:hypothetical protein E1265_25130 [Streptomyces sp. 8K308]
MNDRARRELPAVGTTVRDARLNTIGRVVAHTCGGLWLRPLDGGCEWVACPEDVAPVRLSEALGPLVAEANRRSARPR